MKRLALFAAVAVLWWLLVASVFTAGLVYFRVESSP
jgi:hypothetical protein